MEQATSVVSTHTPSIAPMVINNPLDIEKQLKPVLSMGDHTFLDIHYPRFHCGIDRVEKRLQKVLVNAALAAKMTIIFTKSHTHPDGGKIIATVVISESHIIGVYDPKSRTLCVDIFTCGGVNFDKNKKAEEVILQSLRPKSSTVLCYVPRGQSIALDIAANG